MGTQAIDETTVHRQPRKSAIKVWDPLVRIFHWSLAGFFTLSYLSAEESTELHTFSGYAIIALIGIRLIWGIVGTRHARFSDFVYRPSTIVAYLKSLLTMHPKRYLGHNPAGGVMIILLLSSLILTTTTGLAVYGAEEHAGPLSAIMGQLGHDAEEVFEEVHEVLANFTLFLVFIHLMGVLVESALHRENLIRAMIDGYKRR